MLEGFRPRQEPVEVEMMPLAKAWAPVTLNISETDPDLWVALHRVMHDLEEGKRAAAAERRRTEAVNRGLLASSDPPESDTG
jgi:hypothetical protein